MSKLENSSETFEYPEVSKGKNIVGLNTQAVGFVPKYVEPSWVDSSLPKLYEHYTKDGITAGLVAAGNGFTLNGKPLTIYAGEMHYWRCHPKYWRGRLRRMRACGLNCVSTYMPWNLHEPEKDKYDFGDGDFDLSLFADVATFLRLVYEEDMFVIIKPGPVMSGECDLGGLPSYILNVSNAKIRTSDPDFLTRVEKYWSRFLALYKPFQFQSKGPIIAFQIEDEYGLAKNNLGIQLDPNYLTRLKELMSKFGLNELFFTADKKEGVSGSIDGVLKTAIVEKQPQQQLDALKKVQPDKPFFVSKFQTGKFDQWEMRYDEDGKVLLQEFAEMADIILKYPASINFYLFQGGPSWGFTNGAETDFAGNYYPYAGSYDRFAPLNEAGEYGERFSMVQALVTKYNTTKTKIPALSLLEPKMAYLPVWMRHHLPYADIISQPSSNGVKSKDMMGMEKLDINNKSGQSYGYILYRKKGLTIKPADVLKIKNRPRDVVLIMVDGITLNNPSERFGLWKFKDAIKYLTSASGSDKTLEILVENAGRPQFGMVEPTVFKGIVEGGVTINDQPVADWEIMGLDFNSKWIKTLANFKALDTFKLPPAAQYAPGLFRGTLNLDGEPMDTWLDMADWTKGHVYVNGFNLGRYYRNGPPLSLFCPAPILRKGKNEILVFELFHYSRRVAFSDQPRYLRTPDKIELADV